MNLEASLTSVPPLMNLSLRDPAGQVFLYEDRILRVVHREALPLLQKIRNSPILSDFSQRGAFISATSVPKDRAQALLRWSGEALRMDRADVGEVLEHPRVDFASFPYEWAPEMLWAAASLTLDFAESLPAERLGLKDATPFNVLFQGTEPVLIDYLSIESRNPSDPFWIPFNQFLSTFVNPLALNRFRGIPTPQIFLLHREGVGPQEMAPLLPAWQRWLPPLFYLVTLPRLVAKFQKGTPTAVPARSDMDPQRAQFVLRSILKRLRTTLESVAPLKKRSMWSEYVDSNYSFTKAQYAEKKGHLEAFLQNHRPKQVLDIGCNTGDFSRLAADAGASVVGIDSDSVAVAQAWKLAREGKKKVLPLVVDFAQPSPSVGWNNAECPSFLSRAEGRFDAVLALAVLHHLTLTNGIPLDAVLQTLARITSRWLVIEFIAPEDRAFIDLCRGRNFSHLTQTAFERSAERFFRKLHCAQLVDSSRFVYVFEKR